MSKKFSVEKAIAALKSNNFSSYKCPICGCRDFHCQPEPSTLLLTSKLNAIELKTYVPAVLVSCKKCGHIDLFSAVTLGAIEEGGDDDEQ